MSNLYFPKKYTRCFNFQYMCMYIYIYTKSSYFCIRYIYIYWYMSSLWMLERLELENLCHLPICSSVLGLRFKGLGSEREVFCIFSGVLHPIAPKIGNPKRKLIFQPWFFKGYVKFRGCIWWFVWEVVWWFFRCFFGLKRIFRMWETVVSVSKNGHPLKHIFLRWVQPWGPVCSALFRPF